MNKAKRDATASIKFFPSEVAPVSTGHEGIARR
jgi:hypothetical protein